MAAQCRRKGYGMSALTTSAAIGAEFEPFIDDTEDLPRTFRREKEARAREARERAAQERAANPTLPMGEDDAAPRPQPSIFARASSDTPAMTGTGADTDTGTGAMPASVRAFDVPFSHLVMFAFKVVLASLPALFMLTAILWVFGTLVELVFPWLIKMKILISFPN
jgi:hypothetical protein